MGDRRRFDVFARYIKSNFPGEQRIADIASGKGYLQVALREQGYSYIVSYDKRKIRCNKIKTVYRLFDDKEKTQFDLLVGLHPDEATDVIITQAAKRKIPFVIVPCCVKPHDTVFWKSSSHYTEWIDHLQKYAEKLGFDVTMTRLPIKGRNIVMKGVPINV